MSTGTAGPDIYVSGYTRTLGADHELDLGLPHQLPGRTRPPLPQRRQRPQRTRAIQRGRRRSRPRIDAFPARTRRHLHRRERRRTAGLLYIANDEDPERLSTSTNVVVYLPLRLPFRRRRRGQGLRGRRSQRWDGSGRGRLQQRRQARPLHHELARAAARRLPEHDPEERRDRVPAGGGEVRPGARPPGDRRLGRCVGRLCQ